MFATQTPCLGFHHYSSNRRHNWLRHGLPQHGSMLGLIVSGVSFTASHNDYASTDNTKIAEIVTELFHMPGAGIAC